MKHFHTTGVMMFVLLLIFSSTALHARSNDLIDSIEWQVIDKNGYRVYYTIDDRKVAEQIESHLFPGINHISNSFGHPFLNKFDVYIFPNRDALNKQWQKDWGDSTFQSQCWMVASGVAHRLDILSPNAWPKEACEHKANDTTEIRQLVWHELVHVYHGQYNPDHTFTYMDKLDWLAEGGATYISGQLHEKRLQRVKQLAVGNKTPSTLDDFWKGNEKYGLSGSMVAYIDKVYGRKKLFELLAFTSKQDALKSCGVSETALIAGWKNDLNK